MIGRKEVEFASIADVVSDRGVAALTSGGDELAGSVNAGHLHAAVEEHSTEHALAAGDIEHGLAGFGREQTDDARQDDFALVLAALVADEIVVPFRDAAPV